MPGPVVRRRSAILLAAFVALLAASVIVEAQFRQRGGFRRGFGVRVAKPEDFLGGFQFCRVAFNSDFRGDGGNWSVDYPRADINLSIRLAELTKAYVNLDDGGEPIPLLVRLTDDVMFSCPFIMMTEVGSAAISEEEAARLRLYLQKGGFLWVDDFWGSYAWDWWVSQLGKVLPPSEYPIIDLEPTHPLFSSQFQITKVPQIASIGHWASTGGGTSERYEDSAVAHARAVV
ncbi:MAG TPA: DUF4159 domain-containing protein, partial [Vicinamibacterales bacterium]|nr:DUF4159 domain-containing protein [Vicinamibacterales bacterium]